MHSHKTKTSWIYLLLIATGSWLAAESVTHAQCVPQGTPRKIISDDFTKNRQSGVQGTNKDLERQGSSGTERKGKQKRTYRLASAPAKTAQSTAKPTIITQLGITIWRLRPATARDTGARMLVREKSAAMVPERVEAGTVFHEGDQIRLSVESAEPGYLYVADRELLSDGSMGAAMLIYPWAGMHGDNRIGPGKLIDIPAQQDDPNYFTARRSSPNHAGEILTIIVTNSPINLPISDKPIQISNADLANWERDWGGQTDRYEMEGGAGQTWTTHEQQAAAHTNARQLTREDPAPQSIYRISGRDNKALLVNVRLNYGK
jgi:hypothetical protein